MSSPESPTGHARRDTVIAQPTSPDGRERLRFWLELVAANLLGIAAVATSWSGYQSARWSGEQADRYSEAATLRLEFNRASMEAYELRVIDLSLFTNWLNAYAERSNDLAEFYRRRFRPEFAPAFEKWVATQPRENPHAPPAPFVLPEYRLAAAEKAERLAQAAEASTNAARIANDYGDAYVLKAVIFAIVLFFAGIAPQLRLHSVRAGVLAAGVIICLYGLVGLARLPVQ